MTLAMLKKNTNAEIIALHTDEKLTSRLKSLGLVEGRKIKVIDEVHGNVIIQVMKSRIALACSN